MPPELHFDPARLDQTKVVADREAIRRYNQQRFEMEHLNAILLVDTENHLVAGYKDVGLDEFWIRGHMPGFPLMPGVLMCEAAAQLCSYYVGVLGIMQGDFLGFGGMENVRFRGMVKPGDRLVLIAKGIRVHRRQCTFSVQGFVGATMVFNGDIIGVSLVRQPAATPAAEGA